MTENIQIEAGAEWRFNDILFSMADGADESPLYLGSSDFKVYSFDVSAEKPERQEFTGEGHQSYVTGLARAGETLISCSYDQHLVWWNAAERKSIRRQVAHDRWIRRVIVSPDQRRVISVADDMQCKVWDAVSGELISSFSDHPEMTPHHYPSMLYAVAISTDGSLIATGDRVGHVAIWNAESFEKLGEVEAPVMYTWDPKARRHSIGGIRSLAFSPDNAMLAVGGIGTIGNIDHLGAASRLEIFKWREGTRVHEIEEDQKKGLIEQIIYLEDGNSLLAVGGDHKGFVNLIDTATGKLLAQAGNGGHIHAAVWHEDQHTLFTAGHNSVQKWQLKSPPAPAES